MAPQELMKPRYKVIADFPLNNWYKVGGILTVIKENLVKNENGYPVHVLDFTEYPHLFKRLEWWDGRKPEDMPEYVKDENGVYKVREWLDLAPKCTVFIIDGVHEGYIEQCGETPLYSDILPATEQEYNDYIKSKQSENE